MKKIIMLLVMLFTFINTSYSQWVQQVSPTTLDLYNVNFINLQTGFVSGANTSSPYFYKTTNGGITWSSIINNNLKTVLCWNQTYFLDSLNGWMVGNNPGGVINKTTDGGISWSLTTIDSITPYSIYFINNQTGWIGGSNGIIIKTTNGGIEWNYQLSNITCNINSIYFIDSLIGWMVGGYNGNKIIKTTNGGTNWTTQLSHTYILNSVYFIDSLIGWVVGANGTLFKTTNGGVNWITKSASTTNELHSIKFINDVSGYIVGAAGTIKKTTNNGNSWSTISSPITNILYEIEFVKNSPIAYIVSSSGKILKSTNAGITFIENEIKNTIQYSLLQNYPNPFNSSTLIQYSIPTKQHVSLKIYDIRGILVKTLVNSIQNQNIYSINFNGNDLSSGIYFYKLETETFSEIKKMSLIK